MLENEKTNEKAQHGGGIIAKTLVVAVGNGAGNIVDEARHCNEVNGIGFVLLTQIPIACRSMEKVMLNG